MDIIPTDPYGNPVGGSFPGRLDFTNTDAYYVYLDHLQLTANPLGPGPTYYYFNLDMVATPTITPNGGSFVGPVQVTLACATSGSTIYYTANGTAPTTSSPVYTAPFTLVGSATVVAAAVKAGSTGSFMASAAFTVQPLAPSLKVTRLGNTSTISWPSPSTGFALQQSSNPANHDGWADYGTPPTDNGTTKSVTLNSPAGNLFSRLRY
jgi:hypothetical protein